MIRQIVFQISEYVFVIVIVLPSSSSDDIPTPHILLEVLIRKQNVTSTLCIFHNENTKLYVLQGSFFQILDNNSVICLQPCYNLTSLLCVIA